MHSVTPKYRFITVNFQGINLLYLERILLVSFCEIPKWCLLGTLKTAISGGKGWWPMYWNDLFPVVTVQITSKERVKGQVHLRVPCEDGGSFSFLLSWSVRTRNCIFPPSAISRTWKITCLSQLTSEEPSCCSDSLQSGHLSQLYGKTMTETELLTRLWMASPTRP